MLAYFGHHKCASIWTRSIIEAYNDKTWYLDHTKRKYPYDPSEINGYGFLSDINADYKRIKYFNDFVRGFHVIRDPRDIIVSAYFSHRYSHKISKEKNIGLWIIPIREKLNSMSLDDGLTYMIEVSAAIASVFDVLYEWNYNDDRILEVKMEDLTEDPFTWFSKIFKFLGLFYEDLQSILDEKSFEWRTDGRARGVEDIYHHYRKGVPGDWKNYFKEKHVEKFNQKYPDILDKLEYNNG